MSDPTDAIQRARTRARHRLIGAVVLVVTGVVGFPLVFETQPRPVPVDIPIEIPRKDGAPVLGMPAVRPPAAAASTSADSVTSDIASTSTSTNTNTGTSTSRSTAVPATTRSSQTGAAATAPTPALAPAPAGGGAVRDHEHVITESRDESGHVGAASLPGVAPAVSANVSIAPTTAALHGVASASVPAPVPVSPKRLASIPVTPAKSIAAVPLAIDGARAKALLEGMEAAPPSALRFVVQIGAFADAGAARETRLKVDKLGLKTYSQTAQTAAGPRIRVRVGPFATRDEAIKAQDRARSAGMTAVVLAL